MAKHYRHPSYRQYLPQELLDALRNASTRTHMPMQKLVRIAVKRFLIDLNKVLDHDKPTT